MDFLKACHDGVIQRSGVHQSRVWDVFEAASTMGRLHLQARLERAGHLRTGNDSIDESTFFTFNLKSNFFIAVTYLCPLELLVLMIDELYREIV